MTFASGHRLFSKKLKWSYLKKSEVGRIASFSSTGNGLRLPTLKIRCRKREQKSEVLALPNYRFRLSTRHFRPPVGSNKTNGNIVLTHYFRLPTFPRERGPQVFGNSASAQQLERNN